MSLPGLAMLNRRENAQAEPRFSSSDSINGRGTTAFNPRLQNPGPSFNTPQSSTSTLPNFTALEGRFRALEQDLFTYRTDLADLNTKFDNLRLDVEALTRGDWSTEVSPFQTSRIDKRLEELENIKFHTLNSVSKLRVYGKTEKDIMNADPSSSEGGFHSAQATQATHLIPPHLRAAAADNVSATSRHTPAAIQIQSEFVPPQTKAVAVQTQDVYMPPHLRKAQSSGHDVQSTNDPLATDGKVDVTYSPTTLPFYPAHRELTPPSPAATTIKPDEPRLSIEDPFHTSSARGWRPLALSTFNDISREELKAIPDLATTTTFHPDFLRNTLGGICWSPGLNYVPPAPGPCLLKNRTYYTLDADYEPYLPRWPGEHGAKLTAFFNENPEEKFGDDASCSFEQVPLFVCRNPSFPTHAHRYVYFGQYTQARWSDKLDYDRMVEEVSRKVKEYWAQELSAQGRPEWVTEQLMRHFWPKPEYMGTMPGQGVDGSVADLDEAKHEEKVLRDVKKYVECLRAWEKDARIKTSMIKKDFILSAFERADADDPPALRLWWEYLKCDGYDSQFYETLVALQKRDKNYV